MTRARDAILLFCVINACSSVGDDGVNDAHVNHVSDAAQPFMDGRVGDSAAPVTDSSQVTIDADAATDAGQDTDSGPSGMPADASMDAQADASSDGGPDAGPNEPDGSGSLDADIPTQPCPGVAQGYICISSRCAAGQEASGYHCVSAAGLDFQCCLL